jgi:hypothetical protein
VSALSDALKGVKQLLLLQKQVEDLEQASELHASALRELARDVIAIDKRVVRIETMAEVAATRAGSSARRLPKK